LAADPQRLIALVRGWLGGIANHVIADMLRRPGPKPAGSQRLNSEEPVHVPPRTEAVAVSPVVRALQEELQKLSPLQRDILTAAELYYQPDAARQRLPNGVVKMLARQHGTSSANIRQVRRRTIAGLRKKLLHLIEENE
jgi:hypothetical protein